MKDLFYRVFTSIYSIYNLHKYYKDLVNITEKYINNEINIFEYNYLINDVNECIKVLESEYYEDNE